MSEALCSDKSAMDNMHRNELIPLISDVQKVMVGGRRGLIHLMAIVCQLLLDNIIIFLLVLIQICKNKISSYYLYVEK